MKLENQVALITGSNRGIGHGIALAFAHEGADIVINYRSHADEAQAVAEEIRTVGRRAIVCRADVADRQEVDAMVQAAVDEFGRIDIGVANAAMSIRKPFLELTNDDMETVIGVSLMGVFNVIQACARVMTDTKTAGNLLVISSSHASIPFATAVPYNTCKAGINHMAYTIADELRTAKIRVNVIEPGWIDTPGERAYLSDKELEANAGNVPWGRLGTIDELGAAAVFMCSDDASYVTAATLRVDGGFWLPSRGRTSI